MTVRNLRNHFHKVKTISTSETVRPEYVAKVQNDFFEEVVDFLSSQNFLKILFNLKSIIKMILEVIQIMREKNDVQRG